MIDFRYHLVSLISVFLALAVGVVLGAGPLQNSIGTALEDQVSALRSDRDAVRAERDEAVVRAERSEEYLAAVAPALVADTLSGHQVALVVLPGADGDDVTRIADAVVGAGGEVVSRVEVAEAWVDPARLQYRTTLAGQLLGYLDPAPSADGGADGVLASALAQGLSRAEGDPVAPEGGAPSPDGLTLIEMLRGGDTPLLTVTQEPTAAAQDVLVVGPRPAPVPDTGATATATTGDDSGTEAELERAAWVSLARALARTAPGTAVVGSAAEGDLVALVRADEPAAAEVTTVDGVEFTSMPHTAVLALAADSAGTVGHYGFADSAQAIVPTAGAVTPDAPGDGAAGAPADPTADATQSGS